MMPNENGAWLDSSGPGSAPSAAEYLLGDFRALLRQVGVCGELDSVQPMGKIADLRELQSWLETYLTQILLPLEMPVIAEACGCAGRGETRELIALDRRLSSNATPTPFTSASRKIGVRQLHCLKPLRDDRTVQRYLRAVEAGHAEGWHTLVYGLMLAVYSIPLRQGLHHYGRETVSTLALAAVGPDKFLDPDCQEILCAFLTRLPAAVESALPSLH
jgi:urease accessory protein UreF